MRRLTTLGALGLAVVIGVGSGATVLAQTTWSGSSSPEDLRYRLDILDAELADIRARLGGAAGAAPSVSPGGGVDPGIELELQRLTNQVEQLQNQLNQIAADATRRFSDIEFRLRELEGLDTDDIPDQPLGGQQGQALAPGVQPFGVPGTGPDLQPNTPGAGPRPRAVTGVSVAERGDLDRAVDDVNKGRFDQAEDRLRRFINDYPGSPLQGDAWYWLGESQFVRGLHSDAARSYLNGYQSDEIGPQAPLNLYKLGVTLGRLGELNAACQTLRQVRSQFPNGPSDVLSRADAEADTLTCG
ncbi:MAG: tol-pal system protein YbgF [Pseudomonadota bacterium]